MAEKQDDLDDEGPSLTQDEGRRKKRERRGALGGKIVGQGVHDLQSVQKRAEGAGAWSGGGGAAILQSNVGVSSNHLFCEN